MKLKTTKHLAGGARVHRPRNFEFSDLLWGPKTTSLISVVIKRSVKNLRVVRQAEVDLPGWRVGWRVERITSSFMSGAGAWRVHLLEALASPDLAFKDRLSQDLDRWEGWDALTSPERLELSALLGSLNRDLLWAG